MNNIARIFEIVSHWKIHLYNLSLQTTLRLKIIYELLHKDDDTSVEIKHLMKPCPVSFLPYDYPDDISANEIKVYRSPDGLPYVIHKNKKLYLKRKWDKQQCQKYYWSILIEQDMRSPHKYLLNDERNPLNEDVVADIGAAEGIFSLEIVENVKKIYCFECDEEWLEPLERTFEEFKDKIEIVKKYISNVDDGDFCTLDSFFMDKELSYLKADIEGGEENMLIGGDSTFSNKLSRVLITAYHRPNDEDMIKAYLERYGFENQFNSGYCLYIYNKDTFKPPYARRGVCFGKKL